MRPSLTRRLLTLYLAAIAAVVGITGGMVWVLMRRALCANLDDTLRTEAAALASRLEAENGRVEFELPASQAGGLPDDEPLVQIVDESGQIVFSSAALGSDRTMVELASGVATTASPAWFVAQLPPDASASRVVALYVAVAGQRELAARGSETAIGAWVLAARPLAAIDRTLGELASVLSLSVAASMLAALLIGRIVARRGTQPVLALAASLAQVKPGAPQLVLDHALVPIELEPIVTTVERLLLRVREELERQRQLTADVAHDLRSPVAGVRTLLDVCLGRERSTSECVRAMEKARAALRQLSRLLDDVLTLSRLDANVDEPLMARVSLDEVLGAAVAAVRPLAAARQVSIETDAPAQRELWTDRGMLTKIVSNLLGNAVEHSPAGETVRLGAAIDRRVLELSVADRGPGVAVELRERIFDRFVRADGARAGGDGHHGLGLPIAAGLARLLNGEVVLDGRYAPGSQFVVRVPLDDAL
ncbi:MAG TPA: HAMP domain-containing sensor histidine kinase [Pirellulales bacterium]|nr:HAMP domain-containing sensor histidine kinase [Pirellulales bacterium]